jgi:hypothetical protein
MKTEDKIEQEKTLTAVELLAIAIYSNCQIGARFGDMIGINKNYLEGIIEQAKQMEKEQIRDAWTDGCIGELYELNAYFSSGKYYNETYGK